MNKPITTKSSSILIVDDVPKNIQVVASFLKSEGYKLAFAQNGKNALTQAQTQNIDLILLDIMMPEMDGFEVCSHLKASEKTKDIPVIFLTGKVETESVVQGFTTGAVDYVTKPFNREELLARVKTHLELKHSREEIQSLYEELDTELNLAAGIQNTVMRDLTNVSFLSTTWIFKPYGKVSGDIIDFSTGGEHEQRIFIGDATGHGIPAAFITMMVPFVIGSTTETNTTNETVTIMNEALAQRHIEDKFITGIYTKIFSDGKVLTCNAGHPPFMVIPANGSPVFPFKERGGLPMGMFTSDLIPPYEEKACQLSPGDKVIFYTDGIVEWSNSQQKIFGIPALQTFLEENRGLAIKELLNKLLVTVETFSEGNPCDDDITIIGSQYLGNQTT
ncbi:MAG: SpoIIE family protein phosphatase [SAR324 cluster bacterium]|nr:SpoIIE family protein phosphatase [SAR324 cluster bacterium]